MRGNILLMIDRLDGDFERGEDTRSTSQRAFGKGEEPEGVGAIAQ